MGSRQRYEAVVLQGGADKVHDIYQKKNQFVVVALSTNFSDSATNADDNKVLFYGRILGPDSPHEAYLDNPCDPAFASAADSDCLSSLITQHTLFKMTGDLESGMIAANDRVNVWLEAGTDGAPYNLQRGHATSMYQKAGRNMFSEEIQCDSLDDLFTDISDEPAVLEFGYDNADTPNANNLRCFLKNLAERGFKVAESGRLAQVGDIQETAAIAMANFMGALADGFHSADFPTDFEVVIGGGNDEFHADSASNHAVGKAFDFWIKPVTGPHVPGGAEPNQYLDNPLVQKTNGYLSAFTKEEEGKFYYIDEYNHPSRGSTGEHFHLSYGNSGWESRGTKAAHEARVDDGELPDVVWNPNILDGYTGTGCVGEASTPAVGEGDTEAASVAAEPLDVARPDPVESTMQQELPQTPRLGY
tara:strand:+ start:1 stop:1251 length:1251 start_codon:yes stop_codon:yes gene_type:complete